MTREPLYSVQAAVALDAIEGCTDARLLVAVCDTIDLICDHGDSAEARREQLRTVRGTPLWKVTVRTRGHEWVVLWWPEGEDAHIYCIGAL